MATLHVAPKAALTPEGGRRLPWKAWQELSGTLLSFSLSVKRGQELER